MMDFTPQPTRPNRSWRACACARLWVWLAAAMAAAPGAAADDGGDGPSPLEAGEHGSTDLEQYYLELINRARADPAAEGLRLALTDDPDVLSAYGWFGVDLEMMQDEFNQLSPRPPLAMNPLLTEAARAHSQDMLDHNFQGHTGSDGAGLGERVNRTGYTWSGVGENVFAYADSVWHGHAGFQVDWGHGPGGMQSGRGHRMNIHGHHREVGIGVVEGTNGSLGPEIVTQIFARGLPDRAFVTGVAYYDVNGNGFYDPGEGIGGLTVTVEGVEAPHATANSGGYSVPVPLDDATRPVHFSGPGIDHTAPAQIEGGLNVKVDLALDYQPPQVEGPASPGIGIATGYSFSLVGGATDYEWRASRELAAPPDGAENLDRGESVSAGGYSRLSTAVKFSGASSYHFANPTLATDETFTYHRQFMPGPEAVLAFRSRLGWATKNQIARVLVSEDEGANWTPVYQQAGTGGSGEGSFALRTVSLAAYAGRPLLIRFSYLHTGGTGFTQTSPGVGWYVDQIAFQDIGELHTVEESAADSAGTFSFVPFEPGDYHLAVRPVISNRAWVYGPTFKVGAVFADNGGYQEWAAATEAAAGLAPGTLADDPAGDFSGDGIGNLLAFAMGLSVIHADPAARPAWQDDGGDLVFDYRDDAAAGGVDVVAQVSTDLQTWFDANDPAAPVAVSVTLQSTEGTIRLYRVRVPSAVVMSGRTFVRLVARPLP